MSKDEFIEKININEFYYAEVDEEGNVIGEPKKITDVNVVEITANEIKELK